MTKRDRRVVRGEGRRAERKERSGGLRELSLSPQSDRSMGVTHEAFAAEDGRQTPTQTPADASTSSPQRVTRLYLLRLRWRGASGDSEQRCCVVERRRRGGTESERSASSDWVGRGG